MPAWEAALALGFRGTVLERSLGAPLWLYHEHSFDVERGRTRAAAPVAPRADVCLVDLFEVMPLAGLVTSPSSCIDAFYRISGAHEPHEYSLRVQAAKLLVRPVAALYHAALALPRDATLLVCGAPRCPRRQRSELLGSDPLRRGAARAPAVGRLGCGRTAPA